MVATTVTIAKPPRMKPTKLLARFTSRSEIPEVSMRPPAKIKSGMASSGKLEAPEKRFRGTTLRDAVPFQMRRMIAEMERANPMGTLMAVSAMIIPRMSHSTPHHLLSWYLQLIRSVSYTHLRAHETPEHL